MTIILVGHLRIDSIWPGIQILHWLNIFACQLYTYLYLHVVPILATPVYVYDVSDLCVSYACFVAVCNARL